MRTYSPRQDKTISTSLKVTSIDTETNPASLRRRTKPATGGEALVIETVSRQVTLVIVIH